MKFPLPDFLKLPRERRKEKENNWLENHESETILSNIRKYGSKQVKRWCLVMALAEIGGMSLSTTADLFSENKDHAIEQRTETYPMEKLVDKLGEVLTPNELNNIVDYLYNLDENSVLFDEVYQQQIVALGKDFKISTSDIFSLNDSSSAAAINTVMTTPEYRRVLQEVKDCEKEGFQTDFSIIPLPEIRSLEDPVYGKVMKRVAELGIVDASWDSHHTSTLRYDDVYQTLLEINKDKNIFFHNYVLDVPFQTIQTLKDFPNVLESINHGVVIDDRFVWKMALGYGEQWDKFLKIPENKQLINQLIEKGYSINSFYDAQEIKEEGVSFFDRKERIKEIESFFSDNTIYFLNKLSEKIVAEDLATHEVADLIQYDLLHYAQGDWNKLGKSLIEIDSVVGTEKRVSVDELITELNKRGIYKNIYLPLIEQTDPKDRNEKEFFDDPAIHVIKKLGYHKNPPASLVNCSPRDRAAWIIQACRAMQALPIEWSHENFNKTLKSIIEAKSNPDVIFQDIFKNRNVVLLAHNEELVSIKDMLSAGDHHRFGKQGLIEAIKNQHPLQVELFRAQKDDSNLEDQKNKFINFISSQEKVTIVFDAHGAPYSIDLTNQGIGSVTSHDAKDESRSISAKEISQALIQRYKSGILDRAIIINSSCHNFEFIKNVYEEIKDYNEMNNVQVPLPVAIAESEYGQYSMSNFSDKYGADFFNLLFENKQDAINLKDILEVETMSNKLPSNISVFIPHEPVDNSEKSNPKKRETYFQIAENNPSEETTYPQENQT